MSAYNTNIKTNKLNVLDRVVKKNPKYAHIESNIDTGSSITKYMKKLEEIKTNYRYQQNEIFKRMKISTFVQLILQIANMDTFPATPSVPNLEKKEKPDNNHRSKEAAVLATIGDHVTSRTNLETDRYSTLHSVINGIGEQDFLQTARSNQTISEIYDKNDLPYLLLDIRDKDEYNACHIISALNYPVAMLSRSMNNETKELSNYKNKDGKIIVIYDDDEKIATRAASTFVERGYDNLFMLSGGLKLAAKKFPEGLINGNIPSHLIQSENNKTTPAQSFAQNNQFQNEFDFEKLNYYLEKSLLMNDTASRLSRASNNSDKRSTYSSASMSSKASSISQKPWKPV